MNTSVEPKRDMNDELRAIWMEVLELEDVGNTDDFVALGGHSLLAIRIASLCKHRLGKNITIGQIYRASTIERLARDLQ